MIKNFIFFLNLSSQRSFVTYSQGLTLEEAANNLWKSNKFNTQYLMPFQMGNVDDTPEHMHEILNQAK